MVMEMAQLHDCARCSRKHTVSAEVIAIVYRHAHCLRGNSRKHTVSAEVIAIVYRHVPTTGNDSKEPFKTPSKINFLSHFSEISIS
jgi:hypothetical protein